VIANDEAGSAAHRPDLLCPSAQPDMKNAEVLGVLTGSGGATRLSYLEERLPFSDEISAMTAEVSPTRILRLAATCEERLCRHFDGSSCQLATRIVEGLSAVVDRPPPCRVRPSCRWFAQEGRAACLRCPQVATEIDSTAGMLATVALG
jgi:hypothetical protein